MIRTLFRLARALVAVALALPLSGCLFYMNHELPPNTTFGGRVEKGTHVQHAENSKLKPYLLAGLLPYPFFPTKDMLKAPPQGKHLTNVAIETQFNWFDTIIWVVPGFFYGYYVFAPRHAKVTGNYVDGPRKVVAASAR
ncbi:MAG TPA: hypothetical protein VNE71_02375 [Myxococcota bacterium]|jgi:hypothetical protein|nr:hypothetical protein [Myxococcota bacterium]